LRKFEINPRKGEKNKKRRRKGKERRKEANRGRPVGSRKAQAHLMGSWDVAGVAPWRLTDR
jgi:hypothetical protein